VDLKRLRFARVYAHVREKGHEALPERIDLLPRIPNLADSEVPVRNEAHVDIQPVRREVPGVLKMADRLVVLLRRRLRRRREAD
jgi:hypothetical protein